MQHNRPVRPGAALLPGLALALTLVLAVATPAAAADHQVSVNSNFFSPSQVTIQAGDTVTWTNTGTGIHNVRADNGSFRCSNGCQGEGGTGNPNGSTWSVTRTFDTPGTFGYYCEAHGLPGGLGMAGQVIVQGAAGAPGSLRFSTAGVQTNEGNNATFTVQRVGGDDGQVSVTYSTGGGSATAGSDYQATSNTLTWPDNDDNPRNFVVNTIEDTQIESNETVVVTLSNPTGGAALGSPSSSTLTIVDDDQQTGQPGTLAFSAAEVSVGEGDGSVSVGVTRSGGSTGAVSAQVSSADGSATAGSDYQAVATTVSFAGGETGTKNVDVTILDDAVEEANETFTLMLASPTGGVALGSPSAATVTVLDDDLPPFPCVPDDFTLCLLDDRFLVQVRFKPPGGTLQLAHKIDFTNRAGLFWFFNPANVEMLLKVQNACVAPFNRYWVFLAATTNVEYTVTVVDTQAGMARQYFNPQGQAALPIQDTDAFATCP